MSGELCQCANELPQGQCADCKGLPSLVERPEYLVDRFVTARYNGRCVLDRSHRISKGDLVGILVEDNDEGKPPFTAVGTGCTDCTDDIANPHALG